MRSKNRFLETYSARLCILAGLDDNPFPTRFLAPIDCLKIPAQRKEARVIVNLPSAHPVLSALSFAYILFTTLFSYRYRTSCNCKIFLNIQRKLILMWCRCSFIPRFFADEDQVSPHFKHIFISELSSLRVDVSVYFSLTALYSWILVLQRNKKFHHILSVHNLALHILCREGFL